MTRLEVVKALLDFGEKYFSYHSNNVDLEKMSDEELNIYGLTVHSDVYFALSEKIKNEFEQMNIKHIQILPIPIEDVLDLNNQPLMYYRYDGVDKIFDAENILIDDDEFDGESKLWENNGLFGFDDLVNDLVDELCCNNFIMKMPVEVHPTEKSFLFDNLSERFRNSILKFDLDDEVKSQFMKTDLNFIVDELHSGSVKFIKNKETIDYLNAIEMSLPNGLKRRFYDEMDFQDYVMSSLFKKDYQQEVVLNSDIVIVNMCPPPLFENYDLKNKMECEVYEGLRNEADVVLSKDKSKKKVRFL